MAFVSVGRPRLRELARSGNQVAQKVLVLRNSPERMLSVLQIGISLVGALGAALGGASAAEWAQPLLQTRFGMSEAAAEALSIVLIVLPITYVSIVIGELVPKTLALRNPLRIVLKAVKWLVFFERILGPIVSLLEWSTKKILKIFFRRAKPEAGPTSTDTVEIDQLSLIHKQYVMNLVNIEKKRVSDILLPWERVVAVGLNQPIHEIESSIIASGHTRVPVLQDNALVGILNSKEFMALRASGTKDWSMIIRPTVEVKETDSALKALRLMQEKRSHLAIVLSSGRRIGIVTMEDIFEEIIGDIFDEDDDGAIRHMFNTRIDIRKTK